MPPFSGTPTEPSAPEDAAPATFAALAPLKRPVFRMLWSTWLVANICMWMNDVAAAWMMTSMTPSPIWVALVQTASTLPVFLLGLPSGALADILDRRRYFSLTQFWIAFVATLLCLIILSGKVTPPLLLALIFANGIGLAMRWPVFAAIVPELVSRPQLPAALALNGIAMNASRIIGPLVAGAIIAKAGSAYVFVLNAALSLIAGFVILCWRREHVASPLGRERLFSAMRVGVQFVRQSPYFKVVLLRIFLFFFHSTALLALLPLVARGLHGGARTYTLLLAAMGAGAIATALFMPRLRRNLTHDSLVMGGTAVQAVAMAAVAFSTNAYIAVPAMFLNGGAWILAANSLSVSAQLALPDWVRARGMSMYQMGIMGASASGAAVWGQVATLSTVQASLAGAAIVSMLAMLGTRLIATGKSHEEDLTPSRELKVPVADSPPKESRVLVTVEYLIDPARADEFLAVMQEGRRSRLRQGALRWDLLRDITQPGRYVEQIVDESWTEHLRRFDRVTAADISLRERRLAFHIGPTPPVVRRYAIETEARS